MRLDSYEHLRLSEPITGEFVTDGLITVCGAWKHWSGSNSRTLDQHSIYGRTSNGIERRSPFPSLFLCVSRPAYCSKGLLRCLLQAEILVSKLTDGRNPPARSMSKVQKLTQVAALLHSEPVNDNGTLYGIN